MVTKEIRYTEGPGKVRLARAGKVAVRGEWCEVPADYAAELESVPGWEVKGGKKAAKKSEDPIGEHLDD